MNVRPIGEVLPLNVEHLLRKCLFFKMRRGCEFLEVEFWVAGSESSTTQFSARLGRRKASDPATHQKIPPSQQVRDILIQETKTKLDPVCIAGENRIIHFTSLRTSVICAPI